MIDIDVQDEVGVDTTWGAVLKTAVLKTLAHEQIDDADGLTLVLSDDAQLQQLNAQFRQIDAPTDVLSFPAGHTPGMIGYLGDILISVPYAERQSAQEGHSLLAELQLLTVHGVLHLLGYDHLTPDEKVAMWASQTAVLQQLGVQITLPEDDE